MKKLLLMTAMILPLAGCGMDTVDQGETGVKKTLGKVEKEPLPPGLYFYNPFVSSITDMDNHTLKWESKSAVYTKDVQQADISFAVNYNLSPAASVPIYSTVGRDWSDILLPQVVNGSMKNVIGKWDAIELVANRSKATVDISNTIAESLFKYGIAVTGFQITNIDFKDEFEQAVESKQVAVQKAEQARNETVQVQEEAKQVVIRATADAQAMQIKSAALSQNQNLVAYEAVKKWNGVLPQIQTSGSGTMFNIPLPK